MGKHDQWASMTNGMPHEQVKPMGKHGQSASNQSAKTASGQT
jgi:hypothetical protein